MLVLEHVDRCADRWHVHKAQLREQGIENSRRRDARGHGAGWQAGNKSSIGFPLFGHQSCISNAIICASHMETSKQTHMEIKSNEIMPLRNCCACGPRTAACWAWFRPKLEMDSKQVLPANAWVHCAAMRQHPRIKLMLLRDASIGDVSHTCEMNQHI